MRVVSKWWITVLLCPQWAGELLRSVFLFVCLLVCLSVSAHIWNMMYMLPLAEPSGPPLMTVQYIMNSWFCGCYHIMVLMQWLSTSNPSPPTWVILTHLQQAIWLDGVMGSIITGWSELLLLLGELFCLLLLCYTYNSAINMVSFTNKCSK